VAQLAAGVGAPREERAIASDGCGGGVAAGQGSDPLAKQSAHLLRSWHLNSRSMAQAPICVHSAARVTITLAWIRGGGVWPSSPWSGRGLCGWACAAGTPGSCSVAYVHHCAGLQPHIWLWMLLCNTLVPT
jgi:hypothetical protein